MSDKTLPSAEAQARSNAKWKKEHGAIAIPSAPQLDAVTLDRIAREIGANIATNIDRHYPGAMTERGLFNVKAWARGEVLRWFGPPQPGAPGIDARLRASGAHRRHMKRLQTIVGHVQPGDPVDPMLAAMDVSAEQAALDHRTAGPVIDGEDTP